MIPVREILKNKMQILFFMGLDVIISGDENSNNGDLLRIPLLKDVFERYPTTPINIDVKENNDELIREVSDEMKSLKDNRSINCGICLGFEINSTVSSRTYHILG